MKQSIVTWHPWPENGVEGLPKGEHRIFIRTEEGVEWRVFELRGHVSRMLIAGKIGITHYALASDLERDIEPDPGNLGMSPEDCGISQEVHDQAVSKALAEDFAPHSPKQISGTSPDEDRVRWLTEQGAKLIRIRPGDPMTFEQVIGKIVRLEEAARRQVEREEGGAE